MGGDFDRQQLLTFLRAIDRNLRSEVEVVVVGGAALSIAYGVEKRTSDIDVIELKGSNEDLARALRLAWEDTGLAVAISPATVTVIPDQFEGRLRKARGLRLRRLKFVVPEKYDLALSKIAASTARPHDLDAVLDLHDKHRLSRNQLLARFDAEMARVSVADERQLALTMAVAVAELYGDQSAREFARRYGVPLPKLKPSPSPAARPARRRRTP
ncbi:MAG TPA: DUF6036 family nucleotidyltransferase [Burkholderiales bacterium]|nr:DUF6036 family nucleotidyltransferase [Burkholderiales bacterium]